MEMAGLASQLIRYWKERVRRAENPRNPAYRRLAGLATAAIICSWGNYPVLLTGRHGPTIKRWTNETERGLEHAKYV